jgi:hypothetical protein
MLAGPGISWQIRAQPRRYDPVAGDTEIKIGTISPHGGPASSYGFIGQVEAAYFNKINADGSHWAARSISSVMMIPITRRRQ